MGKTFPFTRRKNDPNHQVPVANTISVVGETDVRWLGTSVQSEVLVIDALLIAPGRDSFTVDGALAR